MSYSKRKPVTDVENLQKIPQHTDVKCFQQQLKTNQDHLYFEHCQIEMLLIIEKLWTKHMMGLWAMAISMKSHRHNDWDFTQLALFGRWPCCLSGFRLNVAGLCLVLYCKSADGKKSIRFQWIARETRPEHWASNLHPEQSRHRKDCKAVGLWVAVVELERKLVADQRWHLTAVGSRWQQLAARALLTQSRANSANFFWL